MKVSEIKTPVSSISGIGPQLTKALAKVNVFTVGDLLQYFPRDYEDRTRKVTFREQAANYGKVHTVAQVTGHEWFGYGRMKTLKILVNDGTGSAELICFNRAFLEKEYHRLPTSVFQADLNSTNILLDENGRFAGIMDFNIAGREVFLNYLFREVPFIFGKRGEKPAPEEPGSRTEELLRRLIHGITIVKERYRFSEAEMELALPLFRCLSPLWFTSVEQLKAATGEEAIQAALDDTERAQTMEIDFRAYMC